MITQFLWDGVRLHWVLGPAWLSKIAYAEKVTSICNTINETEEIKCNKLSGDLFFAMLRTTIMAPMIPILLYLKGNAEQFCENECNCCPS